MENAKIFATGLQTHQITSLSLRIIYFTSSWVAAFIFKAIAKSQVTDFHTSTLYVAEEASFPPPGWNFMKNSRLSSFYFEDKGSYSMEKKSRLSSFFFAKNNHFDFVKHLPSSIQKIRVSGIIDRIYDYTPLLEGIYHNLPNLKELVLQDLKFNKNLEFLGKIIQERGLEVLRIKGGLYDQQTVWDTLESALPGSNLISLRIEGFRMSSPPTNSANFLRSLSRVSKLRILDFTSSNSIDMNALISVIDRTNIEALGLYEVAEFTGDQLETLLGKVVESKVRILDVRRTGDIFDINRAIEANPLLKNIAILWQHWLSRLTFDEMVFGIN